MGKNFQKLYREKRREKEQRQKEASRMSKPDVTENKQPPKAAASPLEKAAPQPHSMEQSVQESETASPPPLDLLRAKDALGKIDSLKAEALEGNQYGNYVSYVEALPAAILQNGLGQALAILLAGAKLARAENERGTDEKAYEKLYDQIHGWLCRDNDEAPYREKPDLMDAIVNGDEDSYIRAQAETLAYLRWLKKFAVAFLKKKENG
jgi:CRISPR-associated protein Cmr5